ncbi:MAG: hypothetical protein EZS28_022073 [Streblomastix strix]|uniref:Uncharacterized protein n=1 Tax=Streblomastix strix TaxID=222440 RepID=A0A5J4VII2_9EUKA|nr:MAG: hypothetical protein EZS28_022073 [Streblomastix strix]
MDTNLYGAISSSILNGVTVVITDTQFIDSFCDYEAGSIFVQVSNTSKDLPLTGYGGGIFLAGNGEYDPSSTKRLDLKRMKIL